MIKSIHHICIETGCYRASLGFYCSLFGFNIIEETANFHGREFNTWIREGDVIIELQTPKAGAEESTAVYRDERIVHVCFIVDNLRKTVDYLVGKGFNSFRKKDNEIIYCVKGGFLVKLTAPEGTVIELREE